jgi:hypothetical protein
LGAYRASSPEHRGVMPPILNPSHQTRKHSHHDLWPAAGDDTARPHARIIRKSRGPGRIHGVTVKAAPLASWTVVIGERQTARLVSAPIPRSKMAIFLSYGCTSPVSLARTRNERTLYAVDMTGGGCSSAGS